MGKNNQTQNAGDNSQQFQAGIVNVYNGITEQRAREICREEFENFGAVKTQEALAIAQQRVQKLEDVVIPKMAQMDKALDAFADPAFQFVLRDAQKTAAASERDSDYELLSELLVDRVNHGNDRKRSLSISEAIKIVDKIDDDALCGLTLLFAIHKLQPGAGGISEGIELLAKLYERVLTCNPPKGNDWLDHLELLSLVKNDTIRTHEPLENSFQKYYNGYVCVGIEKGSDTYYTALEELTNVGLPYWLIMQDHELLPNYVRINTPFKSGIRNLKISSVFNGGRQNVPISDAQYETIEKVFDMYSQNQNLKNEVCNAFLSKLLSNNTINTVFDWWKNLPYYTTLTPVGIVLAQANAQKLYPEIPNILK